MHMRTPVNLISNPTPFRLLRRTQTISPAPALVAFTGARRGKAFVTNEVAQVRAEDRRDKKNNS
jgi:hypothetical protein